MIVKLREHLFEALLLTLLRGETATCSGHVTTGPGSAQIHSGQHNTDTITSSISCNVCVGQYYYMKHEYQCFRKFVIICS